MKPLIPLVNYIALCTGYTDRITKKNVRDAFNEFIQDNVTILMIFNF